eukprot:jgi/Tetstr1/425927/TSEL_016280.t2
MSVARRLAPTTWSSVPVPVVPGNVLRGRIGADRDPSPMEAAASETSPFAAEEDIGSGGGSWWTRATRYVVDGSSWLSWGSGRDALNPAASETLLPPDESAGVAEAGHAVERMPSAEGVQSPPGTSPPQSVPQPHERSLSTLPEGLYMDSWQDPLFADQSVSLPAFLMPKTSAALAGSSSSSCVWGWLRKWRTTQRQSSRNVYETAINPDEEPNTPDMLHRRYQRVLGAQGAPELDHFNAQELNRAYVMRPLRMAAWLLLLLLGYAATLGWCQAGVPQKCMKAQSPGIAILSGISQVLQMGFVTGWFARITHEKRFAWLIAKENLWFYAVFLLTSPVIGLMANLPAFQHSLEDIKHWSASMAVAVGVAVLLAVLSILWHSWQAFRRAPAVGLVFVGTRFVILAFFFTVKELSEDHPRHRFHVYPYLLLWWTSLFSEYNHVVSDATMVTGAAFLVQGIAVHSLEVGSPW